MIIKSVKLENIKSHANTEIELHQGINSIIGSQGSGKTTILEAIGLTIFNSLSYKQNQFIRKGCKTGKIEVTIEIGKEQKQIIQLKAY